jgi:hypothetical protein
LDSLRNPTRFQGVAVKEIDTMPAADTVPHSDCVWLEVRLRWKLQGRIRDFQILLQDCGIILRGFARTYHAKQLAQHAVMTETNLPILANEIEVC